MYTSCTSSLNLKEEPSLVKHENTSAAGSIESMPEKDPTPRREGLRHKQATHSAARTPHPAPGRPWGLGRHLLQLGLRGHLVGDGGPHRGLRLRQSRPGLLDALSHLQRSRS